MAKHKQTIEERIDILINAFIAEWIPKHYAHLMDSDENDGEKLRNGIKDIIHSDKKSLMRKIKKMKRSALDIYWSDKIVQAMYDEGYMNALDEVIELLED